MSIENSVFIGLPCYSKSTPLYIYHTIEGLKGNLQMNIKLKLFLFSILTCFGSLSFAVDNGTWTYDINSDGTSITLTGASGYYPPINLDIPDSIDGYSVTIIGRDAFQQKKLTSVTLPDGLVSVEAQAFYLNEIAELTIPESLKTIGMRAFSRNKLVNLIIPNDIVVHIGTGAFSYNELESVNLHDGVYLSSNNNSNAGVFQNNRLFSITIPTSWTYIPSGYFASNLINSLTIPNNIQDINSSAFYSNKLISITIPDTVNNIWNTSFANNQLTEVSFLGGGPLSIGPGAFLNNQLTSIVLPNCSIGPGNCVLPMTIGENAFQGNRLTRVDLSDRNTVIMPEVFKDNLLANVIIPEYVTKIHHEAFANNELVQVQFKGDRPDMFERNSNRPFLNNNLNKITFCAGKENWPGAPIESVYAQMDCDADGVWDGGDAFPNDPLEQYDSDYDGIGDNGDNCPITPFAAQTDTDNDGMGNACDPDDDNDGVSDTQEIADGTDPLDANSTDTDSDGILDINDADDDEDGVIDSRDAFPLDGTETTDYDSDGVGDNADADDDNDGVSDVDDAFPLDASETLDIDSDGLGNNTDTDDDGDGVLDTEDAFPLNPSETTDTDGDGIGNSTDPDDDGDGLDDQFDAFPLDASETLDSDSDGTGDNSDVFPNNALYKADSDSDGMPDAWETRYGLDPNDASDATSDQDNDGVAALDEFLAGTIPAGSLDIDGNGQYDALTDGLLLLRGMFLLSGDSLISDAVASDAVYKISDEVASRIDMLGDLVDIDGNGTVDALTDGLVILRYLFNLRGDVLINDVIASDATVKTAEDVEASISILILDE